MQGGLSLSLGTQLGIAWGLRWLMPGRVPGQWQDPAAVAPLPSAATFQRGGTEQRHPGRGALSLSCAASANRREMAFPAASERGRNNKWQQRELGWEDSGAGKTGRENGWVVSEQGDLGTGCCLALAQERGTGHGPSLQLPEPSGDAAGWHETQHSSERSSPSSGWRVPGLARAWGLLTDCRALIRVS